MLLWLVLVFLVGIVVGRLVVPRLEPRVANIVDIGNDPNARVCTLNIIQTTTVPWGQGYQEEVAGLKCRERRDFGDTVIQCRCDDD